MVSATLVKILQKKGHGLQLMSALSNTLTSVTGFMFVDDLDLVESSISPWADKTTITQKMQGTVSRWAGILRASGGKLEPSKSFWYLAKQEWSGNAWKYKTTSNKEQISVEDEDGTSIKITKLQAHKARETLGIFTALNRNQKQQVEKLKKVTKTVSARFWKADVTLTEIWEIFKSTLNKTWDYPKVAVSLSKEEWESIIKLVMPTVLNKAGIASKIPRVLLYAPIKYQGFGLRHPFIDQQLQQIECMMTKLQQESFTGKLISQAIEQLKLQIGIGEPLATIDWTQVNKYCTPSWLTSIFTFASQHKITIHEPTPNLRLCCKHDQFIMKAASMLDLPAAQLRQLNNTRQSLQISCLSELTDLGGMRILEDAWQGKVSLTCQSNLEWPRTGVFGDKDLKIWTKTLCQFTGSPHKRRLKQPLGVWYVQPQTKWLYSQATGRLYKECHLLWECYTTKRSRAKNNEIFKAMKTLEGSTLINFGFPLQDLPQSQATQILPPDAQFVNTHDMEMDVMIIRPQL